MRFDYTTTYATPREEIVACKRELKTLEHYVGELIRRMEDIHKRIEELKNTGK